MTPLEQRRFLFITGKGGTGKTTVTAALALWLGSRGFRVLIAVTDEKERISPLLGVPALGEEIAEVLPNIFGVKINPERALREYGEMILKSRAVSGAVFGNKYVRGFFAAVPGLYQWAVLGKAWFHSTEQDESGRPRFDVVLFDAPATGHGLEMLRVPKIIVDIVPPGVLRRDAERAWEMFRDPTKTGVLIVALPEDMPANESVELAEAVRGELGLPLATLVVNQVMAELFSPDERKVLEGLAWPARDAGEAAVLSAGRRAIRERIQSESLKKMEEGVPAPLVQLPRLLADPSAPEAVRELGRILGERLAALPT